MVDNLTKAKSIKNSIETERSRVVSIWQLVAQILGIPNNILFSTQPGGFGYAEAMTLDYNTYDPSCRRGLTTLSDFYANLIFPTKDPFGIGIPSSLSNATEYKEIQDWYSDQTRRVITALHNGKSGFLENKQSFYFDLSAFGTSALATFEQDDDECPFLVQNYGIDNLGIMEGKNSQPEASLLAYNWFAPQIVEFFAPNGKEDKNYENIPLEIREMYEKGEWTSRKVCYCIVQKNPDYKKTAKLGINKSEYKGDWFFDTSNEVIKTEYFEEQPTAVARYSRIRGETYGRSDFTNFINTIVAINGLIYLAYKAVGKMADPAIGIYDNALASDNEFNTDMGEIIMLDSQFDSGKTPVVPIQDIGNIEPLVNFLLTYLQQNFEKAIKLDLIAEIVQTQNMTATEFVSRLAIRAEILSGFIMRHISQIQSFYIRVVNICARREGFLDWENAPKAVKDLYTNGDKWYEINYNTGINNILNAAKLKEYSDNLNMIVASSQIDTSLIPDVDLFDSLKEVISKTIMEKALPNKTIHNENRKKMQQQQQQIMQIQAAQGQSVANKNNADAASK